MVLTAEAISSVEDTSQGMKMARDGVSSAMRGFATSGFRSRMATFPPDETMERARARPRPDALRKGGGWGG